MLFHDTKLPKPPKPRWRRILGRVIKISLVLIVLFWGMLLLLGSLGGNNQALRLGVEDYLERSTGMNATIGRFDNMGFFPDIKIDMGDIKLQKAGESKPSATIETFRFSMRFWDMFFGNKRFETLEIRKVKIDPHVFTPDALILDHIAVEKDNILEASGRYLNKPLRMAVKLERSVDYMGRNYYSRSKSDEFTIDSALIKAKGHLKSGKGGGLLFDFESLGFPDPLFTGQLTLVASDKDYQLHGDLKTDQSHITGSVKIDSEHVKGSIHAKKFVWEDWKKREKIWAVKRALFPAAPDDGHYFSAKPVVDLKITIDELYSNGKKMGKVAFPLTMQDRVLKLSPVEGVIYGGALKGNLTLDGTTKNARMEMKGQIKNLTYDQLLTVFFSGGHAKGSLTVTADLKGEAASLDTIYDHLDGHVFAIAGEGEFPTKLIDIWGAGLVNAMLPQLSPDTAMGQTCFIANLDVQNGKGKTNPLFLDTNRVTVMGEGEINLADQRVNLLLTPKSKDPALLNLATPVRMTGDLFDPKLKPDTLALGHKLGKLALGVINPAFLAYSLTDLGLTDNHPCQSYMKE